MNVIPRVRLAALAALFVCAGFSAMPDAHAQQNTPHAGILYIKNEDGHLARVRSEIPNNGEDMFPDFDRVITGLQPDEQILAIDVRPRNGELYGVSNQSRLYLIDYRIRDTRTPITARPVGTRDPITGTTAPFSPALNFTTKIDIDFNPLVDRIRLVTDNDQNLRLNPDTGEVVAVDGTLAYAAGDANAGRNPNVVGVAYTNSFTGATGTTLFALDSSLDRLATQNPPNDGTLNTSFALPANTDEIAGFDIAHDRMEGGGTAYVTLRTGASAIPHLYAINLTNGAFSDRGIFFFNSTPRSIAAELAPQRMVIISEFRFNGPAGADDEFVELYNNTDQDIVVRSIDSHREPIQEPQGWTVFIDDPNSVFTTVLIPNGTVIPARGHYLITNNSPGNGYSLGGYATPDQTYQEGVSDFSGIALFQSATEISITARLDAAGYSGNQSLFREGAGFPVGGPEQSPPIPILGQFIQYSFYRDLRSGTPRDTDDNIADFKAVNTTGATSSSGFPHSLGAPGPQNSTAPRQRNATIKASLIDPGCATFGTADSACARNRDGTSNSGNNSTFGTLSIRRKFTNNTGAPVTRLRFRLVDVTAGTAPSGTADLRARTSVDFVATCVDNCPDTGTPTTDIHGVTLEPPSEANNGGLNATLAQGDITLDSRLAVGASVNVHFLLGVQQNGSFRFLVNVEALLGPPAATSSGKPGQAGRKASSLKVGGSRQRQ